jgi:hypothetical protein
MSFRFEIGLKPAGLVRQIVKDSFHERAIESCTSVERRHDGRGYDPLGMGSEKILRTLIVQETIES